MVVFVGDRPSNKNIDSKVAFVGTKSFDVLISWLRELDTMYFFNIPEKFDYKFRGHFLINSHTDLLLGEIKGMSRFDCKIVALGNNASKRLAQNDIEHFKLPHPSPRNRQLNNPAFIKQKLQECKEYLKNGI